MAFLLPGATTACPTGWMSAPNSSWSAPRFMLTEPVSSLSKCMEACGQQGAVPACVCSEEENEFAAALVGGRADWAWLGLYQNDSIGGANEGWARCAGHAAPTSFTNWADGEPNDKYGPEDCAAITGQGQWADWPCDVPSALGFTARCICAGPANASASFNRDLDKLEAAWAARMREASATVAALYPIAAVVALLPSLLLLCGRACNMLWRRRASSISGATTAAGARPRESLWPRRKQRVGASAVDGEGEQTSTAAEASHTVADRSLRAARRSAARRRLQVSGAMGQAGSGS